MLAPNTTQLLIGGSKPSVFTSVSDESTINLLVVEGVLSPGHGKFPSDVSTVDNIDKIYKSDKSKLIYLVANEVFYQFSNTGVLKELFSIQDTLKNISFSENLNKEISITTGKALYFYNYQTGSSGEVTSSNGLKITTPVHSVMVDTITFVFDGLTSQFQASSVNSATDYTNNKTFEFETKPGNIVAAAVIDRTIFVIGENNIERWVVVGGDQILQRDNVFNIDQGLLEKNSFSNKLDMFAGIFTSKDGGAVISYFSRGFSDLKPISSAGILKKILNSGEVVNSDIYEIDDQVYYEITFDSYSYIYNFNSEEWTESTSPRNQVFSISSKYYTSYKNYVYIMSLYNNLEKKIRKTSPVFWGKNLSTFTLGHVRFFFSNPNLEKDDVFISGSSDGVTNVVEWSEKIDGQNFFSCVSRLFNNTFYQFSFLIETYSNVIWRTMSAQITVNSEAQ